MPLRNVEIDPDIFVEEPEKTDYDSAERTAAIGAMIERRSP